MDIEWLCSGGGGCFACAEIRAVSGCGVKVLLCVDAV